MRRKSKSSHSPQYDRHGFRGVPPPPTNFSLASLADDALLTEFEVAAALRLSTNTLGAWRKQSAHPLQWLALPNGYIRYTALHLRQFLGLGQPRKRKPSPAPAAIKTIEKEDAAPPRRRARRAKADDSAVQEQV
jgi:hypothetical protein